MEFLERSEKLAELHLHLGGASSPETLWRESGKDPLRLKALSETYGIRNHYDFLSFFNRDRKNLEEYLEMHKLVTSLQFIGNLNYYIREFIKTSFNDQLSYIELRHCPYGRTNPNLSKHERIKQMRTVVTSINHCIRENTGLTQDGKYPVSVSQILCLHSRYDDDINAAIVDMAVEFFNENVICGMDVAGGELAYHPKKLLSYFKRAKENGLKTTAHIFETRDCPKEMLTLIPYLDRIGHGTFIPLLYKSELPYLSEKDICLEVCPTTYMKCGTFAGYNDKRLQEVFDTCELAAVPLVIGTDNSGINQVNLITEFKRLIIKGIITEKQALTYKKNAFKLAFSNNDTVYQP